MESNFKEQIERDPYNFIVKWASDLLPFTGGESFKILALSLVSLILPDFSYKGRKIRTNMNMLILGNSGSGKTTISDEFTDLCYYPINAGSVTPAGLEDMIFEQRVFSIVVGDFSRIIKNPITLKIIEALIEEKKLKKETKRQSIDIDVNGIGVFCGTPQDLSSYITGGFLFRVIPIYIRHNIDQHSTIGKDIVDNVERDGDFPERKKAIKKYYDELFEIQTSKNNEKRVISYNKDMLRDFGRRIFPLWDKDTKWINNQLKVKLDWFRELYEFFRFVITHAFLNIHNRNVVNGILEFEEDDFNVGKELMMSNIKRKYDLLSMSIFAKTINNLRKFDDVMNSSNLSEDRKELIRELINVKGLS